MMSTPIETPISCHAMQGNTYKYEQTNENSQSLCRVLKWSVKMQGTKRQDAMQFFNRSVAAEVMVGARVFGMPLEKYKTMSRTVISAGSDTSHFQSLKALDEAVKDCQNLCRFCQSCAAHSMTSLGSLAHTGTSR
ncbi:unnamed protein product [Sphagnum jensenii]|uniref:Uncharacterized protein n=1 Tax=Sphagnum jensenii TaxID=128206 RepID=A0ABP0VWE6_9BRYO